MIKSYFTDIYILSNKTILISLFFMFFIPISGKEIGNDSLGWKAYINEHDGTILRYEFLSGNEWEVVPFRTDSMSGLAWEGVSLSPVPGKELMFMAEKDNIYYSICQPGF